jgi:hypothetical protein
MISVSFPNFISRNWSRKLYDPTLPHCIFYSLCACPVEIRIDGKVEPAKKHFARLRERGYGKQIAVNLVDENGRERRLKLAYDKLMDMLAMEDVKYVYFNLHGENGNPTLEKLFESGEDKLEQPGYPPPPVPSVYMRYPGYNYFLFSCVILTFLKLVVS